LGDSVDYQEAGVGALLDEEVATLPRLADRWQIAVVERRLGA